MRVWKGAAIAVAATIALASCAASGGEGGDEVTLTYAVWGQDDAMQQIVDAFEEENPGINVELQVDPWTDYWTKLQVSATGGTAPDAFWMLGDRFQVYAANGQLLELDDAIAEAGIDTSVYPEALMELFNYEGHQYGLPKDFDTIGLWYNKELFDAAGVAYPDDTWTWETVRENAKLLTTAETFGIAAPLNRQEGFYNTIAQAGGEVITADGESGYDTPEARAGIQFWIDLLKDGSSPTLQQLADTEAVAQFENGKVAMYYGGSFYATRFYENEALRSKVDVAVLPAGEQRGTVINGIQNVGFSGTEHPEELAKFLLFLGGEEAAKIQAATGAVLPAYAGTQQGWVDSMPEFSLQVFLDQVPDGVIYPVSANTSAWNEAEITHLTPAWELTTSVEDATKALAAEMNTLLAEE